MNTQRIAIVVHGGAGASKKNEEGCQLAAQTGLIALKRSGQAMDGAVAAVVAMENDGRFNAGSGAAFCLDGNTVEMDAAVMDSCGILGAVTCIQHLKNPVLVARAVANTPHWLLAGEGAERFAYASGISEQHVPSQQARQKHYDMMQKLAAPAVLENSAPFKTFWNYALPWQEAIKRYGSGTVGAVVRDPHGHFAVATSTGGCSPSLLGRVGDTPIIGCGFYAGPVGAVAATGIGEQIVRHLLARTVYQWIEQGVALQRALDQGIALFAADIDVGLIAVTKEEVAVSSNREMPTAIFESDHAIPGTTSTID